MSILESIHDRADLLRLNESELNTLCGEIRHFLVQKVSEHGGHLASNLGFVEASIALHREFDSSHDRIVFDVGHQCYIHKMLTGRMNDFDHLREFGGLCGFPKPEESAHDAFVAGHASNAVSVALGMARARTALKEDYSVVAVVGDGALTGGLAYEGLNDLGASGEPVIVLLNDNGMSITKNVGGVSSHLKLLRLKPSYFGLKKAYRKFTLSVPGGRQLYRLTHAIKLRLKRGLIGTTLFEEMGLTYLGPVDGHDIQKVSYYLHIAKEMRCPVLVHVTTQKGRGYLPAETAPQNYHGVGKFDAAVGIQPSANSNQFSNVFGQALTELAANDARICAITAAMQQGTGLSGFAAAYPERFFDVGIAEGHAVAMAAGMAKQGCVPVVAIYSTFLQRSYDMLLHDVALTNAHVIFAVDRCGLVGEDGATHHGAFDASYLRQIPGMTVLSPATAPELRECLRSAVQDLTGPVAIRYPRGNCLSESELQYSPAPGASPAVTIVSYGIMRGQACAAANLLAENGITCDVIGMTCIKPLPAEEILASARKTGFVIVLEDTVEAGSVGREILSILARSDFFCRAKLMNLGDRFIPHGDQASLYHYAKIDAQSVYQAVLEALDREE